ncbi:MAG: DUF3800 domain-containing protein [Acidobacteriota bacterium]
MSGEADHRFSKYIVYVDESGDHGLRSIDPNYPVFVLAFCIFEKQAYQEDVVPAVQALKFKTFGHDMVILHERDIRKALPPFSFLVDRSKRASFMGDIATIIQSSEFTIIAAAIDKKRLRATYAFPHNPYDLALEFCLERLQYFLVENAEQERLTHVVFERRGKREDSALELVFRRICSGANRTNQRQLSFEPIFAPKGANSCGLQVADLVARPIGRHILDPEGRNRAFEIVRTKIRRTGGRVEGRGLKVFP